MTLMKQLECQKGKNIINKYLAKRERKKTFSQKNKIMNKSDSEKNEVACHGFSAKNASDNDKIWLVRGSGNSDDCQQIMIFQA